ncbi:hypothetical protein KQ313_09375 [Synechococcus sp. CS-1325]|uniref:hypothetical protein n=1 Tax=Synechococcus sp. CS-1325 TaxID=2847979 RepID=UPI000DB1F07B|nr:hypothetical protein [Synechococcus sp. CS-1325]MCT0199888.1 hypothetical protein [Synechococcus sp. CS-1325]PZU96868.1 MAG: hypothetical protein DCF24_13415 [Cyanobium sp.]
MASTGHDRQWQLNRLNFEGHWCGTSRWYERNTYGRLDLERAAVEIPGTCYAISFSDPDTGLWDGSGLRFAPQGRRRLPLSRASYNQAGQCWQFRGVAGQSSLAVDAGQPRFGHELNFFAGRARSMLVLLYEPCGSLWRLQTLGVVPFRCSLAAVVDPERPPRGDARQHLAELEGWPGQIERLLPGQWPAEDPEPQACEPFRAAAFRNGNPVAGFDDGLLCSLPELLPAGAFQLQVGCRLSEGCFDQLSLGYDSEQRLTAWERRRFQRS